MNLNEFESSIWRECQSILENRKMRKKDLLEWSTGDVTPGDDEIVIRIEGLGVNAVVSASMDRRKKEVIEG